MAGMRPNVSSNLFQMDIFSKYIEPVDILDYIPARRRMDKTHHPYGSRAILKGWELFVGAQVISPRQCIQSRRVRAHAVFSILRVYQLTFKEFRFILLQPFNQNIT